MPCATSKEDQYHPTHTLMRHPRGTHHKQGQNPKSGKKPKSAQASSGMPLRDVGRTTSRGRGLGAAWERGVGAEDPVAPAEGGVGETHQVYDDSTVFLPENHVDAPYQLLTDQTLTYSP
ncbi:hypothetical protein Tco_0786328 [Tanacetum coccineum]